MSDALLKQMRNEEIVVSKEISKEITTALNSKDTIKKADEISGMSGGWPYQPSKEILKLYGKSSLAAWKKLKPKYKNFVVSISVNSPSNKPPTATAEAVYDGEWRGGIGRIISAGDTVASLSKKIYGYESYAEQVFEANAKKLGNSCQVLPAGFGLEFPKIWVPNWRKEPKVCAIPFVSVKAVKVKLPALQTTIDISKKSAGQILCGNAIILIELEGKAELVAQKNKGELDASFNLKSYEAELKKGFGPFEGGFKVEPGKGPSGSFAFKVFNSNIGGMNFSGKINVVEGAIEVALGSKPFTLVSKGISYKGTITLTAKIRVLPNPKYKNRRERRWEFDYEVNPKTVLIVAGVAVVFVVGGWIPATGAAIGTAVRVAFVGAVAWVF